MSETNPGRLKLRPFVPGKLHHSSTRVVGVDGDEKVTEVLQDVDMMMMT